MRTAHSNGFGPLAVCNEFIELGAAEGTSKSMLELMKLAYFAHGWHLAHFGDPLINEGVEAWVYGPVFPTLYHSLKGYGRDPIRNPVPLLTVSGDKLVPKIDEQGSEESVAKARHIIRSVWDSYKGYTGGQLVSLTHDPGTPWADVWDGSTKRTPITTSAICEHFVAKKVQPG